MRPVGRVFLILLAIAGVAGAEKIEKTRQSIRKVAREPWVDGHMRRAVRVAGQAMNGAVRKLGGLKGAVRETSNFMMATETASFPNGAVVIGQEDRRRGMTHRHLAVEGGGAELAMTANTMPRGYRSISVDFRSPEGRKGGMSRSYTPSRRGLPAEISSSSTRGTHERPHGAGTWQAPDVRETDPQRALTSHLDAVRAYDALTSTSGRRAVRKLLRRIDALVAAGDGKASLRTMSGMNGVTIEFPGGATLATFADELGSVNVELEEGGVKQKLFLNEVGGRPSLSFETTRPRAYKAGMGERKDKLYIGTSILDDSLPVERTRTLTRPVPGSVTTSPASGR